jgi:hypothetical protein
LNESVVVNLVKLFSFFFRIRNYVALVNIPVKIIMSSFYYSVTGAVVVAVVSSAEAEADSCASAFNCFLIMFSNMIK